MVISSFVIESPAGFIAQSAYSVLLEDKDIIDGAENQHSKCAGPDS